MQRQLNGLYVSDDSGEQWEQIENDLFDSPSDIFYYENRIYLAQKNGVFVSPDQGSHWFAKSDANQYIFPTKKIIIDNTRLYVNTTGGGIWEVPVGDLYDSPVIADLAEPLAFFVEETIQLSLENFVVEDGDNTYPDDFELIILESDDYTISDNGVIVPTDENGTEIMVEVQVSDGFDLSNTFETSISFNNPVPLNVVSPNQDLNLYPNPVDSFLNIPVLENGNYSIEILNTSGQTVKKIIKNSNHSILEIDISTLNSGLYFISLEQQGQVINQKFIKR